jgi:putative ABC transport system permease protein
MLRISLRNLWAHKVRLFLSGAAVVLGVAFVSGTLVFTDTLEKTFTNLFENTASDVTVSPKAAFDTGLAGTAIGGTVPSMPESVVADVREVEGVAVAEGYVQAEGVYVVDKKGDVLNTGGAPGIGVNWTDEAGLSPATLVEGRSPLGEDEIVLDTGSVEKTGYEVGDTVPLVTTGPRMEAELVGVMRFGESGGLAGASLTAFHMDTAQRLLLEPGKVSGVSVLGAGGVTDQELAETIAAALGADFQVKTQAEQAQDLAAQLEESLQFFNTFLLVFAGVALFVGTFLILNTFSMLVAQRTRELALFRALGASRRQTTGSVLGEALVLGVLGSITGLGLGYGLALLLKVLFGSFGLTLDGALVFAPATVAWALAIGVLVTLAAAYLPARRAARVPPVVALQGELPARARSLRLRLFIGAPLTVGGGAALAAGPAVLDGNTAAAVAGLGGYALVIGAIVLSPLLARPFVRVVGAALPRLGGKTGQLARENAMRNPRRTATTASALMIGLALVTGFSIMGASMKASVDAAIGDTMQADYVVSTSVAQPFTPEIADELAATDGVDSVTRSRFGIGRFDGEESLLVAYDTATVDRSLDVDFVTGGFGGLRGDGLLLEEAVAAKRGLQLGDQVDLAMQNGQERTLQIGGTFERNNALGTYLVSMETYTEMGGAPMDRYVYVNLAPDAGAATRDAVRTVVAAYPIVDLKDPAQFQEQERGQVDQMLMLVNALLVLSVLIAVLGVVNTLALSVIERTRELGLLRAVGMRRREVRRMVRWESVVISLYGAVAGLVIGVLFGVGITGALRSQGIGEVVVPYALLVAFLLLGAVIGVVAAVFPARRAARLRVLEAIAAQ